jgi:MFS family permease
MRLDSIHTFTSLRNSNFRLYFVGMVGQWASMNMGMLARSWVVYEISDSGIVLGLAALANAVPMILLSLWGGAIADRLHKKYILIVAMIASGIVSAAVGVTLSIGYLSDAHAGSWWILIAASVLQGGIMGLMMPARQSIIAEIVSPDLLMNAVSLNMMGMNTFRILAPAATGFLMAGLGFAPVYYIMGGLYIFGAVCIGFLPRTAQKLASGGSAWRDIIDGFSYIRRERTMLHILIFTLIGMICGMPFMQLMPMITKDILHVGESGQGILMSVSGVGAIVGSLALASGFRHRRGFTMLVTGLLNAIALAIFGFSHVWWLSLVSVIFVGLGQTGYRATGNTLVQHYTEPEYRGRAMSFIMMGIGFSSLGTFFAGILAQGFGVQWAIGGLAVVFAVASVGYIMFSGRLRTLD